MCIRLFQDTNSLVRWLTYMMKAQLNGLEKGLAYSRLFRVGNVIHAIKSNMRCAKITTISVQDVMVDSQNM